MRQLSSIRVHRVTALMVLLCIVVATGWVSPSGASAAACTDAFEPKGSRMVALRSPDLTSPVPSLQGSAILHYGVDPSDRNRIFASNAYAMSRTLDGGCTWEQVFSLVDNVTQGPIVPCEGAVSEVDRLIWLPACSDITSVDVAPSAAGGRVYVQVASYASTTILAYPPLRVPYATWIFVSDDDGATWQMLKDHLVGVGGTSAVGYGHLEIAPSDAKWIYVTRLTGLFVSNDGGRNWLRRETPPASTIGQPVISPVDPKRVWLAMTTSDLKTGVYESLDAGLTWAPLSIPFSGLADLAVWHRAGEPPRLAASDQSGSIAVSADGGSTWQTVPTPEPPLTGSKAWNDLAFGRSSDHLFGARSFQLLRFDLRRGTGVFLKSDSWFGGGGDHSLYELRRVSKAVYFLVLGCGFSTGCSAIGRFSGIGA